MQLTDGLMVTLEVDSPATGADRWLSTADVLAIDTGGSFLGGRVSGIVADKRRNRPHRQSRLRYGVKVEIPTSRRHGSATLNPEQRVRIGSGEYARDARVLDIATTKVRPLTEDEERRIQENRERWFQVEQDRLAIKTSVAKKLARFAQIEREGGNLSVRDRLLIGWLIREGTEVLDASRWFVIREIIIDDVDITWSGEIGPFGLTEDWVRDIRKDHQRPLTPCSGLWQPGKGLLSVIGGPEEGDNRPHATLVRLRRLLKLAGVESAPGLWEVNRGSRYTLDDLMPATWDGDNSRAVFAVEAMLYVLRDRYAAGFDASASDLAESDEEQQRPLVKDDFVDAGQPLRRLKSRLIPAITQDEIEELERILRVAQSKPPEDLDGFVRDYNQCLDTFGLRLSIDGEVLGRLRATTAREGYRYIQFSVPLTRGGARGGGRGGFPTAKIKLVRVPDTYIGRRSSPSP